METPRELAFLRPLRLGRESTREAYAAYYRNPSCVHGWLARESNSNQARQLPCLSASTPSGNFYQCKGSTLSQWSAGFFLFFFLPSTSQREVNSQFSTWWIIHFLRLFPYNVLKKKRIPGFPLGASKLVLTEKTIGQCRVGFGSLVRWNPCSWTGNVRLAG